MEPSRHADEEEEEKRIQEAERIFQIIFELITQGINVGDIKKLKDAGICNYNDLNEHVKTQNPTGIKDLSQEKVEKIFNTVNILVNQSKGFMTGSGPLIIEDWFSQITTGSQDITPEQPLALPDQVSSSASSNLQNVLQVTKKGKSLAKLAWRTLKNKDYLEKAAEAADAFGCVVDMLLPCRPMPTIQACIRIFKTFARAVEAGEDLRRLFQEEYGGEDD